MMFCRPITTKRSQFRAETEYSGNLRWRREDQEEVRMEVVTDPMKYFCRAKSMLIAEVA